MKDIRLYEYEAGQLRKPVYIRKSKKLHFHISEEEARKAVTWIRQNFKAASKQFVIVEYTDKYESKIIEVL